MPWKHSSTDNGGLLELNCSYLFGISGVDNPLQHVQLRPRRRVCNYWKTTELHCDSHACRRKAPSKTRIILLRVQAFLDVSLNKIGKKLRSWGVFSLAICQ
jgi:hypothetical protein